MLRLEQTVAFRHHRSITSGLHQNPFSGDKKVEFFLPVLAALATITVTLVFFVVYRDFLRRRRETQYKDRVEMHVTDARKAARSQGKPRAASE
jgi:hypothetical protein